MEASTLDPAGLPGFIIIGGQKCGTTSLHHILAQHPDVYMPDQEVFFFDVDDIEVHPDFFVPTQDGWTFHDFEKDLSTYAAWYREHFVHAAEGQLIGEDSTTYLASRRAPERIHRLLPDVKLIAMLRDPVDRAYSLYWHNVSAGRATAGFEQSLLTRATAMLRGGHYREHLARYRQFQQEGRLLVIFLEDLKKDPQAVVDRVLDHLDLSALDLEAIDTRANAALPPIFPAGRIFYNAMLGRWLKRSYNSRIPNMPGFAPSTVQPSRGTPVTPARKRLLALAARRSYPPMSARAREFLQRHYARENAGLSELLGEDVATRWPYMAS